MQLGGLNRYAHKGRAEKHPKLTQTNSELSSMKHLQCHELFPMPCVGVPCGSSQVRVDMLGKSWLVSRNHVRGFNRQATRKNIADLVW